MNASLAETQNFYHIVEETVFNKSLKIPDAVSFGGQYRYQRLGLVHPYDKPRCFIVQHI